jgi:hypothetical protein
LIRLRARLRRDKEVEQLKEDAENAERTTPNIE